MKPIGVSWSHCGLCIGDGKVIHVFGEVCSDNYPAVESLTPPPAWESNRYIGWVPLTEVLAYRLE